MEQRWHGDVHQVRRADDGRGVGGDLALGGVGSAGRGGRVPGRDQVELVVQIELFDEP